MRRNALASLIRACTLGALFIADVGLAQTPIDTLRAGTANDGLYSNRIADIVPPLPYTEICIVDGSIVFDIHDVSESTAGGLCEAGDVGWIVERDERVADSWVEARAACLLDQMRLPEPFEWVFSCLRSVDLGLNEMTTGSWEWASNRADPTGNADEEDPVDRLQTATMGDGDCATTGAGLINSERNEYRCVR